MDYTRPKTNRPVYISFLFSFFIFIILLILSAVTKRNFHQIIAKTSMYLISSSYSQNNPSLSDLFNYCNLMEGIENMGNSHTLMTLSSPILRAVIAVFFTTIRESETYQYVKNIRLFQHYWSTYIVGSANSSA